MSLRFVIGRTGTGKTALFYEEIRKKLTERPDGPPILYIVPDQMTFLSEYELIQSNELTGMIRAQVFSFTRLAWRIFQETGGASRNHVTSTGLNMLIKKIIEEHKKDLKLFRQASDKTGFIQQVEQIFTEFKHYCVQPEDLAQKREEVGFFQSQKALSDKMHDLELIYRHFEEALSGKYLDSNDYLSLLAESIDKSGYLQDAEVYIDGFHSFTPQEYLVIDRLMKTSRRVSVSLMLDRPFRNETPDELNLFRMTGETYENLYELASQGEITVEEDVILREAFKFQNDSLKFLESQFQSRPVKSHADRPEINLMQAVNRRAEIEGIAREIRRLVMEEGYRYKDIAVLVRNANQYQGEMETIFYDYEIPYFIDQKRSMLNHPLVELVRSVLEVINSNWRYEHVFRVVKTDLLFPPEGNLNSLREQMDRLENYVLAYGIKGGDWTKKGHWTYRRFRGLELAGMVQTDEEKEIEKELAVSRDIVTLPILRLSRRLKKAGTGRELCEAVYLFLEELEIPRKLEMLSETAEEKGELVTSREHDQAWNDVMELLDQFVEILGDTKLTLEEFIPIINAGLEEMRFSLIPPAIDQVFVANFEQSRLSNIKVSFVAGLNDGILPAKFSEGGVLSDEDRTSLMDAGMNIAPDSRRKLLNEEFVAYRAFTSAEERLLLSYPLADDEGKALQPSPYIDRIRAMFPEIVETAAVNDPAEVGNEDQFEYVSHPDSAAAYLTGQLNLKIRNYPIADFWWDVYNFYMSDPHWKKKAERILSSLFFRNETKQLSEDTSKQLYGENITASVSRMELFHSCPFSHFALHGLKLREREIYKLEAPHIGDLFHAALKWIADQVNNNNLKWADLTKEQCEQLAREAVAHLAPKLQNQILLSSNRFYYIKRKLEQVIGRASYTMSGHAKESGFSPVGIELAFGPRQQLPPLSFALKNGMKMELQGRIDRVDKAENDNGVYLRVIDYKSSSRELDLSEIYYGLSLQMLTYLDIIITYSKQLIGKEAFPAGVFYFHLHNPMIQSDKIMTLSEIEEEIFKRFKMKGLVLEDPDLVRLMDFSLESGDSNIISAGLKKDGTLNARSKSATKEELGLLRRHVRSLYQESGNAIISGEVGIDPYRMKDKTPCKFCLYKPVCQFDPALPANEFRLIHQEKREDVIARIREEGEEFEN
ncbi:helicase-exonuclease AddAB subunit AddB [Siminovitchia acidinfaciens]|uniref:ATP-dependent helicase/deoxyribonuclease subunit B n=1 Tax=Siminovitchia acidinfaciens TaxID=2321395 RepID=A0A429Y1Z9_9BACI|nr:helicase-exonuclease AddAB subunit AddB [Siminovitchia acidinfaciens]RST75196.1 helicase-exonuclease AddAB subunit AddB [Siminovitchia acidinfaciens]